MSFSCETTSNVNGIGNETTNVAETKSTSNNSMMTSVFGKIFGGNRQPIDTSQIKMEPYTNLGGPGFNYMV